MDKEKYKEALKRVVEEINECSKDSLDDDGSCVCCQYPCWMMIAKEAIEKQCIDPDIQVGRIVKRLETEYSHAVGFFKLISVDKAISIINEEI